MISYSMVRMGGVVRRTIATDDGIVSVVYDGCDMTIEVTHAYGAAKSAVGCGSTLRDAESDACRMLDEISASHAAMYRRACEEAGL